MVGELTAAASAEVALLTRARRRDPAAIDALYVAHVLEARRLAVRLAGASLADDLVADSFARVISQLNAGRGPSEDFRSYLLATIRNRFRDVQRRGRRERPVSHQAWILEGGVDPIAGPEASLDRSVEDDRVAAAFDTLPQDWREVLWHVELRGRPVPEAAELMGLTPAAVSSLAYRAREGLRLAFLDQLLEDPTVEDGECRWVRERLSRYLRDRVSDRVGRRVELHLDECRSCSSATDALGQVNRRLAGILLPAFLACPAKLALAPAGVTAAAGTAAEVSTWSSVAAVKAVAVAAAVMVGVTASTLSSAPVETTVPGLSVAPTTQVAYVAEVSRPRASGDPGVATGGRQALPVVLPAPALEELPVASSGTPLPQRAQEPVDPDCVPERASDPPFLVGAVLAVLTAPLDPPGSCEPSARPASTVLAALPAQGLELVRGLLDQVSDLLPPGAADLTREVTETLLPEGEPPAVSPEVSPGASPAGSPAAGPVATPDSSSKNPEGPGAETPREPSPHVPPVKPSSAIERLAEGGRDLLQAIAAHADRPSPG